MKCKDCIYFEYIEAPLDDRGICINEKIDITQIHPLPFNDGLEAQSFTDDMINIYVGKNFGCIHFKEDNQ